MMKFFGVFFLLIGLGLSCIGAANITIEETSFRSLDVQSPATNNFYQSQNGDLSVAGHALVVFAISSFIVGIILCASKSKRQLEKEFELELFQSSQIGSSPAQQDVIEKIEKLGAGCRV